jgi:serine/threonine protein kinase
MVLFVMDLYPDNLAARNQREPVMAESDVVPLAIGVAEALGFAPDQDIVHRDIKPGNILFAEDGRPVLTDFGVARAVSDYVAATGFNMTIGTPASISPEQAQGRPLDGRSDLYSLGITLYRATTGDLPFRSKDWFELARIHVETPPEPPERAGRRSPSGSSASSSSCSPSVPTIAIRRHRPYSRISTTSRPRLGRRARSRCRQAICGIPTRRWSRRTGNGGSEIGSRE